MKKLGGLDFLSNFLFLFGGENIEDLKLYKIRDIYARYIYYQDKNVMKSFDEKKIRPYVGIVFKINDINYFAPLSSPKVRHVKMKNNIDFMKINGGRDGVINLNNMIPISKEELIEIDIKEEIRKDKKYGIILRYQIEWCNNNKERIVKNATKLYNLIANDKASLNLKKRSCNFKFLEEKLNQFILNSEKSE